MKHLMKGLTVSAALAMGMPALAQTQTAPPAQMNAAAGSGHPAPIHHRIFSSRNSMADRLNAEELATLEGAAPVHRMPGGGKQLTSPGR